MDNEEKDLRLQISKSGQILFIAPIEDALLFKDAKVNNVLNEDEVFLDYEDLLKDVLDDDETLDTTDDEEEIKEEKSKNEYIKEFLLKNKQYMPKDNSKFTIKISGIVDKETKEELPEQTYVIKTAYYPMYTSVDNVRQLVDILDIPEDNMRSYIRDASEYANFVAGGSAVKKGEEPSFEVQEFVRTKVILDCLLRSFMFKTSTGGDSYKLDVIEYKNAVNSTSFGRIIKDLRDQLRKWQDAIRGYINEGRAKPRISRVGLKSAENSDIPYTNTDKILNDISRSAPQWS